MEPQRWYTLLYNAYLDKDKLAFETVYTGFYQNIHRFLIPQITVKWLKKEVEKDLKRIFKMIRSKYRVSSEDLAEVKNIVTRWQAYRIQSKKGADTSKEWLNSMSRTLLEPAAWRKADAAVGLAKKSAAGLDDAEREALKDAILSPPGDLLPVDRDAMVPDNSFPDISALSPSMMDFPSDKGDSNTSPKPDAKGSKQGKPKGGRPRQPPKAQPKKTGQPQQASPSNGKKPLDG